MVWEYVVGAAIGIVVDLVVEAISALRKQWGQQHLPETSKAELSETDQIKAYQTRALIGECFGTDPVECLKNASNKDRIRLMTEFADQLADLYGLDIEVDVTVNELHHLGAYNWKEKKAVFNIALLMVDGNHEHFDICVREILDTIIHELRHAVQYRTVDEPGFWDVDDERRLAWAQNMAPGNYISPSVNMRAYANQPIERDAVTFAAAAMEGVCRK